MKLIVVHGPPGVGKYTVAQEIVARTGFPLLHYHALGALFGPLFGYGTPPFLQLRDQLYPQVLRAAADHGLPGVVATFIFEPSIDMDAMRALWDEVGADLFFVGLTCQTGEHRARVGARDRGKLGGIDQFDLLEPMLRDGTFDFPALPGASVVIDTTGMSARRAAREALSSSPEAWGLRPERG